MDNGQWTMDIGILFVPHTCFQLQPIKMRFQAITEKDAQQRTNFMIALVKDSKKKSYVTAVLNKPKWIT